MIERILLNLLLTMTPVFGYQLMMFRGHYHRGSNSAQYIMGILCGASSVLCMMFPVVIGSHYLWDMRWVSFLLGVLYGRVRGGAVTAVILLGYRAVLGGPLAWLDCFIDAIILFPITLKIGQQMRKQNGLRQVIISILLAAISYIVVETSIYLYFVIKHQPDAFIKQGYFFFLIYGFVTACGFVFSVILIESILKQIEVQNELQQTEKMNLVGDLASSFAHEIRNPLTVAKGFVQFIGESLQEGQQRYTDLVVSELDRAEHIVTNYLNLSKPQVEKLEVFALRDTIPDLVELMSPYANVHNAVLHCQVEPRLYISADKQRLNQAIMNIVKNAIESLSGDGQVRIKASRQKSQVLIEVSDTGVGMTEEQLRRLGNPFYSTKSQGTGLGLMVTLRLIEEMNGRLNFESEQGVGTKVLIRFPAAERPAENTARTSNPLSQP